MAGQCPRCGSARRRLISPGYWECTAQMLEAVIPRGMQGAVTDVPLYGICGRRYHNGTTSSGLGMCGCGVGAIGTCQKCGQPRCGDHTGQSTIGFAMPFLRGRPNPFRPGRRQGATYVITHTRHRIVSTKHTEAQQEIREINKKIGCGDPSCQQSPCERFNKKS